MARFINPVPEYRSNSKLFFFKSGTNTQLVTYADELQTIPNPHPVLTDSLGNCPNIFYSGSAKLIVLDENDVQYIERDPVGGEKELGDFALWDNTVIYDKNDIVEGSDGKFYISLVDGNQANDPTTDPTKWSEIKFLGVWNVNVTYSVGSVVQTSTGNLWKSLTSNTGNDPETDSGTNWIPAIDGEKVPEVITVEERTTTVIAQTGGGALTALRNNELRDAGAYTLPLANSVDAEQTITISQPDRYKTNQPTVTRSGSDTITDSDGADTDILFDNTQSIEIILTSDGVSDWSL